MAKDNTRKNQQVKEVELRWVRDIRPRKKSGGIGIKNPWGLSLSSESLLN
jgi:hypothetical protein